MLTLDFPHTAAEKVNKITKYINPKKETSPDKILPKMIKLSANIPTLLI